MTSSPPADLHMVDLTAQHAAIRDELDAAIAEVLDRGHFIKGAFVARFEEALATYLGGHHVIGVGNGTDALQLALMALGVGPGDEVITSAFTFIATAEAAALLGARPVFADIDPQTFNLDASSVAARITPRTKAIVPVHLFGQPADLDALRDVADAHDLPLVEDAAQAVGARYKGRFVGFDGAFGTLSFFPSKNLGAMGDGGAVLTNDDALAATVRKLANHGSSRKYHNEVVGINSRLDALQAALLHVKLRHLDGYTAARRTAADRYDALLADLSGVTTPYRAPYAEHVFHQYTLRIEGRAPGRRDALSKWLRDRQIPHMVYYPVPLHRLPVFAADPHAPLPHTERAAAEVLSLPMHTELSEDQQAYIADAVRAFVHAPNA